MSPSQIEHPAILNKMHEALSKLLFIRDTLKDAIEFLERQLSRPKDAAFLGDVLLPHELRTPLTGLLGIVTIIHPLLSNNQELYNAIARLSTNLVLAIDNILILLQLQRAEMKLADFPHGVRLKVDASSILSLTVAKLDLELKHARVGVIQKVSRDGVELLCDKLLVLELDMTLLSSLLLNIGMTAIHNTIPGSKITMAASLIGSEAVFSVTFPVVKLDVPLVLNRIFSSHNFENEKSDSQIDDTLELGLICRLAQILGGAFKFVFESDDASQFTLAICISEVNTSERTAGMEEKKLLVLIVEDNPVNLLVIEKYLTKLGHEYHTATSGRQAIEAVNENQFDLVLLDLGLPNMTGLKICEYLGKKDYEGLPAKIIVVTAEDETGHTAGLINGILKKPVFLHDLKSEIERVCFKNLQ